MAKKQVKEVDKETDKLVAEQKKIYDFVKSDDWSLIKKKLFDKLITIDSIASVPKEGKSAESMLLEYRTREGVVSIVLEWIKDIEGTANQYLNNQELMNNIRKESLIEYFE